MYFTKGNRVIIRVGGDKKLQVLCVNGRFKYYSPIFESRGWKGRTIIHLDSMEDHVEMPFEFSDSDRKLYNAFGKASITWDLLNKFYVEKRGHFNEEDDDYTLSASEGEASMFMWATDLYLERYEWYVRVDELNPLDKDR
jgi:hypothetical protein